MSTDEFKDSLLSRIQDRTQAQLVSFNRWENWSEKTVETFEAFNLGLKTARDLAVNEILNAYAEVEKQAEEKQ